MCVEIALACALQSAGRRVTPQSMMRTTARDVSFHAHFSRERSALFKFPI